MLRGMKHLHFIGIGGVGMSALAHILLDKGYIISGSDIHRSPLTAELEKAGAKIFVGHKAANIAGEAIDAVVVSTAIHNDNPEVAAAEEQGIKKLHRSDINAYLLNQAVGVAVAGAHGKTTTTSMIGVTLTSAGLDPTVVVGGVVRDFGSNARLGKGEVLVSEADESDGSFLKLLPRIAVVTNVEDDHLDYYGTVEAIEAAFQKFIERLDKKTGCAVVCYDNAVAKRVAAAANRRTISYAINDESADYRAENIKPLGTGTRFAVTCQGKRLGEVTLLIPGRHNVLNALATIAVARELGVSFEMAADGLGNFHGAKRRFETKGKVDGIWIVDDYAHHPTEIASTISAARQTEPKRLIVAFQPHRYTRTQLLAEEFGRAFGKVDLLILTDIYSAGEKPIAGINGQTILRAVEKNIAFGQEIKYIENRQDVAPYLKNIVQNGDLVLTMGAGDIEKTGGELISLLQGQ